MRPDTVLDKVVLSTMEFDVVCEAEELADRRHIVLDVPSPGATYTERAELVADVWMRLRSRKLADPHRDRVEVEFGDLLALLDRPQRSIDVRVWAAGRMIRALAAVGGGIGLLTIVDGDTVTMSPLPAGSLPNAAVSVAGAANAGEGRSVTLPNDVLRDASDAAGPNDQQALIDELRGRGIGQGEASSVARMAEGMGTRGQFGAESASGRSAKPARAGRVVGFHDTPSGRYLHVVRPSADGRKWSTIVPADNQRIAEYVGELLDEVVDG